MGRKVILVCAFVCITLTLADAADARRSFFRPRRIAEAGAPDGWCPDHLRFRADGDTASIQLSSESSATIDLVYVVEASVFERAQGSFDDSGGSYNFGYCVVETYDPLHSEASELVLEGFDAPEVPWVLKGNAMLADSGVPDNPLSQPWDSSGSYSGVALGRSGTVTVTLRNLVPGEEYVVGVWWIGFGLDVTVDTNLMSLLEDRFLVTAEWRTPRFSGNAVAIPETSKIGLFRFRENPDDIDLFVRMDRGCDINGFFWFQVGGLTQAGATVVVTDTATNQQITFSNPLGTLFQLQKDRRAFSCD